MAKDEESENAGEPGASRDVALIHGVTPEGELRVLRQKGEQLELGAIRPMREGVPITGEVVKLTPRKELPLLCDVTTILPARTPAAAETSPVPSAAPRALPHKGPAQVATDEYRANWDRIWNRGKAGTELN
jgi:hypothetical protein